MPATARPTSASRSPRPSPCAAPTSLQAELESLLGLGIDAIEVVDAARLQALLEPVGPIEVELPSDVTDADGDVVAEAGAATLDPGRGGGDPRPHATLRWPALDQYPAATAVWSAVADAVGEGIGPPAERAAADGSVPGADGRPGRRSGRGCAACGPHTADAEQNRAASTSASSTRRT